MKPRVTSFRLAYLTEITHTGGLPHAQRDGSEGFKLHLSDKRRNLFIFNFLTNTHSESFEVPAEVFPEDPVLLRHDAASVGNLMQKFRPSISLRTYPVMSGQSRVGRNRIVGGSLSNLRQSHGPSHGYHSDRRRANWFSKDSVRGRMKTGGDIPIECLTHNAHVPLPSTAQAGAKYDVLTSVSGNISSPRFTFLDLS